MRYPDYVPDFKCIADKCLHSCCVGWEIDIDDESLQRFVNEEGILGDRLRRSIKDGAFVLSQNERCPFLDKSNLCELILAKGEGYLCDICTEHPRYYNFYDNVCEMGIGACCEEAARLILSYDYRLVEDCEDCDDCFELTEDEIAFFESREAVRCYFREKEAFFAKKNAADVINKFIQCERLDESWTQALETALKYVGNHSIIMPTSEEKSLYSRIADYLIYRHGIRCFEGMAIRKLTDFIECSLRLIHMVYLSQKESNASQMTIVEILRQFSAEVEYSDVNLEMWFD